MSNRFTSRLSDNDDFKRDELIRKIEHAVEHMTLAELEALSYDMFTKDISRIIKISIKITSRIITDFRKANPKSAEKPAWDLFMSIKVYV